MPDQDRDTPSLRSTSSAPQKSRNGRWIAGVVVVVAAAALMLASYWYEPIRICQLADAGAAGTCSPWGVFELTPFLLVAILFILPDVGELSIVNLFTLKRRVDSQQLELNSTMKRQDIIERQLSQMTSVTTSQHLTQQFFSSPAGSAAHLIDDVEKKRTMIATADVAQIRTERAGSDPRAPLVRLPGEVYVSDYTPDQAHQVVSLIEQWEELIRFLQPSLAYVAPERRDRTVSMLEDARRGFMRLFTKEIDVVRSVRNSVAHARYVPPEDLHGALEAAKELHRILASTNVASLADLER